MLRRAAGEVTAASVAVVDTRSPVTTHTTITSSGEMRFHSGMHTDNVAARAI